MQRGFNCHRAHSSPEVMLSSWIWCSSRRCEIFVFLKWPLLAQDSLHSAVGCFAYFIASARNSLSSAEWLRLRQMFLHIHRAWWYNWQSSWRGAVCISLCVSPFHTSSSYPFSSTILPFYQHLRYFTLGPSSAEHLPLGWVQQGEDTELCRGLKSLMLLPQQIYSSLHGLNVPFGIFSLGKTFPLGEERGKQKISSLTNPKTKYGLRNPLVPFWMISYLKEWIHNTIVLILIFEYLLWDLSQVEIRGKKKNSLEGKGFI